ncbi:DUF2459 domain-containing protein [Mesobacterium pallidum]|uniref:DUF2459 domain-containing protein n=1 Tax=Mesobacterium pallidum TaxID=2872037 RepID=UPI001EE2D73A|nr:DUF2459 domain-containing protein [Mesobacterium pallidum]
MPLLRLQIRAQIGRGQSRLSKLRTFLRGIFLGLALVLGGFAVAGVIGAAIPNGETGGGDGPVTVHLLAGPIHYDFLLPADGTTRADFAFATAGGVPVDDPRARWIVAGWGAAAFYTTAGTYADVQPGAVLRGIVGDGSVLHVSVAGALRDDLPLRTLRLTQAEYDRLKRAILASAPDPTFAASGFGPTDAFFASPERFHLFRTCNVWVAEVMARAGLRFGRWTPAPYSVTLAHRLFQAE